MGGEHAAEDRHAEGAADLANGVIDCRPDAGLRGRSEPMIDSVVGAQVSAIPVPMMSSAGR